MNGNNRAKRGQRGGAGGGARYTDAELKKILQKMKPRLEREVAGELACDTKTQRVLKTMQKDQRLWDSIKEKVEVRVIKTKDDCADGKIIYIPQDEREPMWSGRYHVYATVDLNGRRMIIDLHLGGPDSCAKITEDEFLRHHWQGMSGRDYELKNLAPFTETIRGGEAECANDLDTYSVEDFMSNNDVYDPSYYPSHRFYYKNHD